MPQIPKAMGPVSTTMDLLSPTIFLEVTTKGVRSTPIRGGGNSNRGARFRADLVPESVVLIKTLV